MSKKNDFISNWAIRISKWGTQLSQLQYHPKKDNMDAIIREINRSYVSIEKGEKGGFDGYIFAEDHTHSVLNTVTNKEVNTALEQAVDVIWSLLFHSMSHSKQESSVLSVKMIFSQFLKDVM